LNLGYKVIQSHHMRPDETAAKHCDVAPEHDAV